VDIDGSVYLMISHPHQATTVIGDWFSATLPHTTATAQLAEGANLAVRHVDGG